MKHNFEITDQRGKTRIAKKLRAAGYTVSSGKRVTGLDFSEDDNKIIIELTKQGFLFCSTSNVHRNKKKVRGIKREVWNTPTNRLRKYLENERREFAVELAKSYHARIADLYRSDESFVQYGQAGNVVDWDYYAKSYRFPKTYKTAGARIENKKVILQNYRSKDVYECDLPPRVQRYKMIFDHPGLTYGDLFCIKINTKRIRRFGEDFKERGFGVKLKDSQKNYYWEHGATLKAIKKEQKLKEKIARDELLKLKINKQVARATTLICRLVNKAPVTFKQAREAGYCESGIRGFCERYGIDTKQGTTLGFLKDKTQAVRLVEAQCRYLAEQLVQRINA